MSIIRTCKKANRFAQIDRTALNDSSLTWQAKGLLAYMLSMPDDWSYYVTELSKHSKSGRDATSTALNELIKAKYVYRIAKRDKGKFKGYDYFVFEEPTTENGFSVYGLSENGESNTTNTDSTNIDNTNTNNSQSGTQSEIDSLKKELKQLKAKKQNNQYTPALTLVTAKKEIDRLYTTDSLHQLFCTSVKPVDKKIVKLAKESFILKYSFERYPIFNQDKLQTALFKWIANQRPEYKTKTQTQTESNKITASTQMTRQECIDANLENGFNF